MKKSLAVILLMTFAVSTVTAAPIYTYTETTPVASGINLTDVREFHTDGNISYSVIKADLTEPETELRLYKSQSGPDVADTVVNLSKTRENTVAAINADFFSNYKNGKNLSLGIEVDEGNLIQSPIYPDTMATIFYDGKEAAMSYLNFNISVVAPNGEIALVRHLNKHTDYYGDIVMYTPEFNGGMSPAPGNEICEVVVEDGIITEFRRQMPSVKIPENGCVLVVSEGVSMFLANNFLVGDKIEFTYTASPDILNVKTAFGGGAMLVKDGTVPTEYSHVVSGRHPRSAIGIDKDGTTLYLVAVDGRQEKSRGMTMNELSSLMLSLGCYNAVNLDGGGSTNMVASTPDNPTLHTVNSPTENRKVINAVGLTYSGKSDKAGGIILKTDKDVVYVGSPVQISASAYDEFGRPFDGAITLTADSGSINNCVLTPDKEGKISVTASIGEVHKTIEIYSVATVSGIEAPPYLSLKKGETRKVDINVFDKHGNYVPVSDASGFEVTSSNPSVLETDGFTLRGKTTGTAVVTIAKDGAKSHISVCVGGISETKAENFETLNAKYKGYPTGVKGSFELSKDEVYEGDFSGKLSYDFTEEETEDEEKEDVSKAAYLSFDKEILVDDSIKEVSAMFYMPEDFSHEMRVQFTDGNGKIAIASFGKEYQKGKWQKLTASIPDDFARPLKLTRVYALYTPGEEKDSGSIYIDSLTYPVTGAVKFDAPPANVYTQTKMNGKPLFAVSPVFDGNTLLSSLANKKVMQEASASASGVASLGNISSFKSYETKNALFIELDTSKDGIRKSDSKQWESLKNAISASDKQNLYILANSTIFGTDEFENKVIRDYLSSLDKKVSVITGGEANSLVTDKGVNYFCLGNRTGVKTNAAYLANYRYLVFSDDGEFEWKECYPTK